METANERGDEAMALPMIHLLAAYDWAKDRPEYAACPEFYLGTISPDAIHVRDGRDKSHKNEVHLNNWRSPDPDAVLAYWRGHKTPFDIGYGIHVLLDGHWAVGFRRDFPEMLLPGGKPDPEIYYNDISPVDSRLYYGSPLRPFLFGMLERAAPPEDHPLLTSAEIGVWRDSMREFYAVEKHPKRPIRFITMEYVQAFLDRCSGIFNEVIERME